MLKTRFLALLLCALPALGAAQVDRLAGASGSVAIKAPVKAVSTGNLTLAGEQTVNSVALVEGDRVLAKDQTTVSENGVYVVSTGSWTRAKDFDGARDIVDGTLVVSNNDTSIFYRVTTNDPITIGTSSINFEIVSGSVTQSSLGQALFPRTTVEIAAGVTPTNYAYEVGNVLRYGADHTGSVSSTTAFQNALLTGYNVYVPAGTYLISDTLKIKTEGQTLYGHGTYTTRLKWTGSTASKNFIEIQSTRRDSGDLAQTRTGMQLRNFMLESAEGSTLASAIWIEDGVFHIVVEKLRLLNFFGPPTVAFIKFDSGSGYSYPVHPTLRDIVMTGVVNAANNPVPKGVWFESVIEPYVDNVAVYSVEEGWVFGTSVAANLRNVSDGTFTRCHAEIGDRGEATTNGIAAHFYGGVRMQFYGCKFTSGASFGAANDQRSLVFSTPTGIENQHDITFTDSFFWGIDLNDPVIYFTPNADYRGITFNSPVIDSPSGVIQLDADVDIVWRDPVYNDSTPEAYLPRFTVHGITADTASLADGEFTTASADNFYLPYATPFLSSFSLSLQGQILTAYKTSVTGLMNFSLSNESAGTVDLSSGRWRWREFMADEIRSIRQVAWDPASLAENASAATTVAVPGAAIGDFVAVSLGITSTSGLKSMILRGYVSAANVVTVRLTNLTTVTTNFPSSTLTVYLLNHKFEYYGSATYDPASLANGDGATTTVTVTGAALGDFVVASFSNDLQGIILGCYVSAADTAACRYQNETGGTIDLSSGTLAAGVYKRHTSL